MKTKSIYKITNLVNNKGYIGQSVDPKQRWRQHKKESKKDIPKMVINLAMKKHGVENFTFTILTTVLLPEYNPDLTEIENEKIYCGIADKLEDQLIEEHQTHISTGKGYNVSLGGSTSPKSDEWKQKMTGRKLSEEAIIKIKKSRAKQIPPMLGKSQTNNQKEFMKNKHLDANYGWKKGNVPWNKGIPFRLGHEVTIETRNKIANSLRKVSLKDIEKIKSDPRSAKFVAKEMNLSKSTIIRLRKPK